MAFEDNNLVGYERNRRARDNTVGPYVLLRKALERMCTEYFGGFSTCTCRLDVIATSWNAYAE